MGLWFRNKEREFSKWLMGEAEAPFSFQRIARKNLLQAMFRESPFLARCDAKYSISDRVLELYRKLSLSTHTRGYRSFETVGRGHSGAIYNPKNFSRWFVSFWESYSLLSLIMFLRFPKLYLEYPTPWEAIVLGMQGTHVDMAKEILKVKRTSGSENSRRTS
jgi:hypothetical protein